MSIDLSTEPTLTEMLADAPAEMRRLLANLQLPDKFTDPVDLPTGSAEKLDAYQPACDSLKLKKHLYALHLQTHSLKHTNKAITTLVELTNSKKPEVARRACMSILKLSQLDNSPDLYPLEEDFFYDKEPTPPKRTPQKSPAATAAAVPSPPPAPSSPPIENRNLKIETPPFLLTTTPPPPKTTPLQKILNHTHSALLLTLLLLTLRPHPSSPSQPLPSFSVQNSAFPSSIAPPKNPVILPQMANNTPHHTWRFFRAGGFDQVRIDSGLDIANLRHLDRKLWVALACPTRGLEFDHKTLDLIDTDHDARIRAPELLAATDWTCSLLKNPDQLTKSSPALPLDAINDATPEGKQLLASARQILINLGSSATAISPEDTADTVKIFAQTQFNGDGILPPDSADDPAIQAIITDIISCFGADPDRSGKPGITQEKANLFFADADAFATWQNQSETDPAKAPLGPNTAAAALTVKAVAAKIEDFFARCRLSAFDPRAATVISRDLADYASLAPKDLSSASAEVAAFPLARITPNASLPLKDTTSINPAWRTAIAALHAEVIQPLFGGPREHLTEDDWEILLARFAPFDTWLAAKAGHTVEKIGLDRIRAILATDAKKQITALIAKDKALEPEANAIAVVDKLVRYHRDLYHLLNNFVSFRDFYRQTASNEKAVFQIGTLFLDQRSCNLCIRVEDAAKHALMAPLSRTYLAYCDCSRKTPDGTIETMTIAAAFTAGDSDNLMVGRNGVFWDRQGNDWDAMITKIVDNPISIRQAFFAPYKRAIRWVSEQMAKRAADADAVASTRMQAAAGTVIDEATGKAVPPPPPPPKAKLDVGVVAALGVALGALSTAFGVFLTWLSAVSTLFIPIYAIVVMLLISGPSMLIAFFKLRQRNLGPILDANGWAVNAKAKINIPFGRSLTGTPKLPPGSHRDLVDPYAEKHTPRNVLITLLILLALGWTAWYFGLFQRVPVLKYMLPKSAFVIEREKAATPPPPPATEPTTVSSK